MNAQSFARRGFFHAAAASAALLAARPAAAQTVASFSMMKLPFDPQKIKGLSERILISHYENNYGGAVKRLNAITEQLASLDFEKAPVYLINGLKREELIAANSMTLHEIYFSGLGEPGRPNSLLTDAIAQSFGSLERWKAQFGAMGRAMGGGSGWVLLTYDPHHKRLLNAWAADHTTTLAGGQPLLALDMYEHAYQMDFGAKAGDYVTAAINAIDWSNAEHLYAKASRA